MDPFLIAFLFIFVVFFISRSMNERALRRLTDEEKARLIDEFSSQRLWSFAHILLIVAGYYWLTILESVSITTAFAIYFFAIVLFMVLQYRRSLEKLRSIQISPEYIKTYQNSTLVKSLGLIGVMLFLYGILIQ